MINFAHFQCKNLFYSTLKFLFYVGALSFIACNKTQNKTPFRKMLKIEYEFCSSFPSNQSVSINPLIKIDSTVCHYDRFGNMLDSITSCNSTVYKYDQGGNWILKTFSGCFGLDMVIDKSFTCREYNEQNLLLKEVVDDTSEISVFEYNKLNQLKRIQTDIRNFAYHNRYIYFIEYNEKGQKSVVFATLNGEFYWKKIFLYDSQGHISLIRTDFSSMEKHDDEFHITKYDNFNRLRFERIIVLQSNFPVEKTKNLAEQFDSEQRVEIRAKNFSYYISKESRYEYSDKGNLTSSCEMTNNYKNKKIGRYENGILRQEMHFNGDKIERLIIFEYN